MQLFEYLAEAFVAEGTNTVFGLLGDGNMAWLSAMEATPSVHVVHVRHEAAGVTMAEGYSRATGRVGVASVTCGPGLTQTGTALAAAAHHRTPLVVFAGDTPMGAGFHLQELAQDPFVRATGAEPLRLETVGQAGDLVTRAFLTARRDRRPVVLSVPYDLQEEEQPWAHHGPRSTELVPATAPLPPAPDDIRAVAELLRSARRPLLLAGAGAVRRGCRAEVLELAVATDALLATTLRAVGWFDGHPRSVGLCGAFATEQTREVLAGVDLVVGIGASLGYHTTEGGYIFPAAAIVQLDVEPTGLVDGQRAAHRYVRADALLGVRALLDELRGQGPAAPAGRADGQPIGAEPATSSLAVPAAPRLSGSSEAPEPQEDVAGGTLHPAAAARAMNRALPADRTFVVGAGHFWNFVVPALAGRDPSRYHFTYDFGVVGQAVPIAIGVCLGGGAQPVAVVEGDGSLLMNVQELETVRRLDLPLLVLVMNDGALGAEYHKLRAKGRDGAIAHFGRTDIARIAEGFGLAAKRVDDADDLAAACARFFDRPRPTLLDIHVDHMVASPTYRRLFYGESAIDFDAATS